MENALILSAVLCAIPTVFIIVGILVVLVDDWLRIR